MSDYRDEPLPGNRAGRNRMALRVIAGLVVLLVVLGAIWWAVRDHRDQLATANGNATTVPAASTAKTPAGGTR